MSSAALAAAAPDGVDMVFENVGGMFLDTALMHVKLHARVALCGLISEYNSTTGPPHGYGGQDRSARKPVTVE
jgi:NADPH-dependent curcumin reductase CurA